MTISKTKLVPILFILFHSYNLIAQTVSNPIGTNNEVVNINEWKDNLYIQVSERDNYGSEYQDAFGIPMEGLDTFTRDGVHKKSKHQITGDNLVSTVNTKDGTLILGGGDIIVNGVSSKSNIVFVHPNGSIDTSLIFDLKLWDEEWLPHRYSEVYIHSMTTFGDTLYVAGAFSEVNGIKRMGVLSINTLTKKLTTWDLKTDFCKDSKFKKIGSELFIYGSFQHIDRVYTPYLTILDLKTLSLLRRKSPNRRIKNMDNDSTHVFYNGSFDKIGFAHNNLIQTTDLDFSSPKGLPYLGESVYKAVMDDEGGTYVVGKFNQNPDSGFLNLAYIDSSNVIHTIPAQNTPISAYDILLMGDTLVISSYYDQSNQIIFLDRLTWGQISVPIHIKSSFDNNTLKKLNDSLMLVKNCQGIDNYNFVGSVIVNVKNLRFKILPSSIVTGSLLGENFYAPRFDSNTEVGYNVNGFAQINKTSNQTSTTSHVGPANCIITDNAGGYFIAGKVRLNVPYYAEGVVHILSNGEIDPLFNCEVYYSGGIKKLALFGDTLVIAGDHGSSYWSGSSSSLKMYNLATNSFITACPKINGNIDDILITADTLFIAGMIDSISSAPDYKNLIAISLKSLSVLPWNPLVNGRVSAIAISDRHLYAAGEFDSCFQDSTPYLVRLERSTLQLDSTFIVQIISGSTSWNNREPEFCKMKMRDGALFLAGKFDGTKFNGEEYTGLLKYDLITDSITDFELLQSSYTKINDFNFIGDTLIIVGNFYSILGSPARNAAMISLIDTSLVSATLSPNGDVYEILIEDSLISYVGNFTSLGNFNYDYYKYNIRTGKIYPTLRNYTDIRELVIIDNYLYGRGSGREINGFNHSGLYKYDLSADTLMQWNSSLENNRGNFPYVNLAEVNNQLIFWGNTSDLAPNDSLFDNVQYLGEIDTQSGEATFKIGINGSIEGIIKYGDYINLFGFFNQTNSFETQFAKMDLVNGNIDKNFQSLYEFYGSSEEYIYDFEVGDSCLYYISGSYLNQRNKRNGKDSLILSTDGNHKFWDLYLLDSILYVRGKFTEYGRVVNFWEREVTLDTNFLSYNVIDETISNKNLALSTYDNLYYEDGNIISYPKSSAFYSPYKNTKTNSGNITEALYTYNRRANTYSMLDSLGNNAIGGDFSIQVVDSFLYVLKASNYNNTYLIVHNLEQDTVVRTITVPRRCDFLVSSDSFLLLAGEYGTNFTLYNKRNFTRVMNPPSFNGAINSIVVKDSIAYIGGDFTKVNNMNVFGLAKLNLNSLNIEPFQVPYEINCQVKHLELFKDYLLISGQNVEPNTPEYKNFSILNTQSENLFRYRPTIEKYGIQVNKSAVVNNLLVLFVTNIFGHPYYNDSTLIFEFATGKKYFGLENLKIKATNLLDGKDGTWIYGKGQRVTAFSQHGIARIDGDLFDTYVYVNNYTPDSMAIGKDARMIISGFGFTNKTKFWLQNPTDTLHPVDNTIRTDGEGYIIEGLFSKINAAVGSYDLLVKVPGDTLIKISDAVWLDSAAFRGLDFRLQGRDTIRPLTSTNYTLEIHNNSNFDNHNTPIFLSINGVDEITIREKIVVNGTELFDATGLEVKIDSLLGDTFSSKLIAVIIPEINAGSKATLSIQTEAKNNVDSIKINAWHHGPLSHSSNTRDSAYSDLLGIPLSCIDSMFWESLNLTSFNSQISISRKKTILDFGNWLKGRAKACGYNLSKADILKELVPHINSSLIKYSESDLLEDHLEGKLAFIDNIQLSRKIQVVNSYDPNIKIGYKGYGDNNQTQFIPKELYYEIHFENDSSATAPVQKLLILDTLDKTVFDVKSVIFSELSLSDNIIQFYGHNKKIDGVYELENSNDFNIEVKADVDTTSGVLALNIQALDRYTSTIEALDPFAGFLPPNRDGNNGNGYISFYIDRLDGASEISNTASIIFDNNDAIPTPPWVISKDAIPPSSTISATLDIESKQINLSWQGEDNQDGSGVKSYTIYWSSDDKNYSPLLANTTKTGTEMKLSSDSTYYFYSIATDVLGNTEDKLTYDAFIKSTSHLGIQQFGNLSYSIYPNPSAGIFTIKLPKNSKYIVNIYSVIGEKVSSYKLSSGEKFKIHKSGIYFCEVKKDDQIIGVRRIIVE